MVKNSDLPVTRSDFAQGHRVLGNVSYEIKWNDNLKTTFGLLYEGSQSRPVSYIYQEGRDLLNDDSRDNALIYVPASQNEITFDGTPAEQETQWNALNAFIEGNDYLRSRRGDYAERNGDEGPWSNIVDLKFLQDFSINTGNKKHTLQASLDIFNFTNLLNKDWGKKKFTSSNVALLRTETAGPDPVFSFDTSLPSRLVQLDDSGIQSSRWQMQVGLRYIFN